MPSQILERILADIKLAMKSQEKEKLAALRLLHSEIKNVAIDERRDPTDEDAVTVIAKAIKQRQESIELFKEAGRNDLVSNETFQLELYRQYQSQQLTEEELVALVEKAIADTGAAGRSDMGKVMKALMPHVKGKADGKHVSSIVTQKLG